MNIVVIGGGAAAVTAAEAARGQNAEAEIDLYTAEGFLPYMRPRLSKGIGVGLEAGNILIKPRSWYTDKRVTVHLNTRVDAILPAQRRVRMGDAFPRYDALVIATGALPFMPPVITSAHTLHTLRGFDGMERIRDALRGGGALTIVGGGVLGLELAWETRAACTVSVLEAQPWLLPRQLTEQAAAVVERHFKAAGVRIETNTGGGAFDAAGGAVVVSAGVRADTRLAADAGIEVGPFGVVVDERMRTSIPGIYAAGDCMQLKGVATGFWQVATMSGSTAGANAAGGERVYAPKAPSAMMRIGALDVLSVGRIDADLRHVNALTAGGYVELCLADEALAGGILIGDAKKKAYALIAAVNEGRRVKGGGALDMLEGL